MQIDSSSEVKSRSQLSARTSDAARLSVRASVRCSTHVRVQRHSAPGLRTLHRSSCPFSPPRTKFSDRKCCRLKVTYRPPDSATHRWPSNRGMVGHEQQKPASGPRVSRWLTEQLVAAGIADGWSKPNVPSAGSSMAIACGFTVSAWTPGGDWSTVGSPARDGRAIVRRVFHQALRTEAFADVGGHETS
ncbi:hypothetical protein BC628DRAFT_1382933 [Trametes gibbosa]|nr:hypothetical protein BC628DRAFT_1382933 [Trametes gibbosa]